MTRRLIVLLSASILIACAAPPVTGPEQIEGLEDSDASGAAVATAAPLVRQLLRAVIRLIGNTTASIDVHVNAGSTPGQAP